MTDRRTFLRTLALSPLLLIRQARAEEKRKADALITVHEGAVVKGVTIENCQMDVRGSAHLDAIHFITDEDEA